MAVAFVIPREGETATPELARELQEYVRVRLSAHEYPRQLEFIPSIPTTSTGKVMRGELRELERRRSQAKQP